MAAGLVAGSARLRMLAQVMRHPSAILLLVQLAGLLLYPFIEGTRAGSAMLSAFGVVVLLLAIRMVHRASGHALLAAGIAVPAVALNLIDGIGAHAALLPWSAALEALFYFYAAGSLIAYMLQDHAVTSDELYAAGATFTLLAWAFAFAFSVCQQWYPGSFTAAVDPTSARSWMELLFLSFSLLSGVGLSDVVPILPQARALVMLEQFAGVMYIAVVVSRLIGLTILKAPARRSD